MSGSGPFPHLGFRQSPSRVADDGTASRLVLLRKSRSLRDLFAGTGFLRVWVCHDVGHDDVGHDGGYTDRYRGLKCRGLSRQPWRNATECDVSCWHETDQQSRSIDCPLIEAKRKRRFGPVRAASDPERILVFIG
jgi:hypothetical protein